MTFPIETTRTAGTAHYRNTLAQVQEFVRSTSRQSMDKKRSFSTNAREANIHEDLHGIGR